MNFPALSLPCNNFQSVINTNLANKSPPNFVGVILAHFKQAVPYLVQNYSEFLIYLALLKNRKELYILLLFLSTRCLLHMLIILTDGVMSHFARVLVFNSGIYMTDVCR